MVKSGKGKERPPGTPDDRAFDMGGYPLTFANIRISCWIVTPGLCTSTPIALFEDE